MRNQLAFSYGRNNINVYDVQFNIRLPIGNYGYAFLREIAKKIMFPNT